MVSPTWERGHTGAGGATVCRSSWPPLQQFLLGQKDSAVGSLNLPHKNRNGFLKGKFQLFLTPERKKGKEDREGRREEVGGRGGTQPGWLFHE